MQHSSKHYIEMVKSVRAAVEIVGATTAVTLTVEMKPAMATAVAAVPVPHYSSLSLSYKSRTDSLVCGDWPSAFAHVLHCHWALRSESDCLRPCGRRFVRKKIQRCIAAAEGDVAIPDPFTHKFKATKY